VSLSKEKSLGGKYKDASVSKIVKLLREEAQHYRWRVIGQKCASHAVSFENTKDSYSPVWRVLHKANGTDEERMGFVDWLRVALYRQEASRWLQ
jgi:hypothetical protein